MGGGKINWVHFSLLFTAILPPFHLGEREGREIFLPPPTSYIYGIKGEKVGGAGEDFFFFFSSEEGKWWVGGWFVSFPPLSSMAKQLGKNKKSKRTKGTLMKLFLKKKVMN